jgi:hypothetical protein
MTRRPSLLPDLDEHERYDPPNPEDNVFDAKPPERQSDYYCLARKRYKHGPYEGKWGYCYQRAGAGTDHLGYGRCKYHGGATTAQAMRYAALGNPTIAELVARFMDDPDPLNLRDELAAARALFKHFVDEYGEISEALKAWHASFDKKRRGLHDLPLYHIEAILNAVKLLGRRAPDADAGEMQEALERGLEQARESRRHRMMNDGHEWADDLYLEKPTKVRDIAYGVTILKVVQGLVDAIIKHEKEAHLSVFAFNALMEKYGAITRKHVVRHLKRKGVNDDEEVDRLIAQIAAEWDRVPVVAESRVPRLAAEQQQRDEYLRAGPSAKA